MLFLELNWKPSKAWTLPGLVAALSAATEQIPGLIFFFPVNGEPMAVM